jgi:hypothetical protein
MTIELTFYEANRVARRPPALSWVSERQMRPATAPAAAQPADNRDGVPAPEWRVAGGGVQRAETIFAVAVCVGLLALGAMTFGYAFGGLAAVPAANAHPVAASE